MLMVQTYGARAEGAVSLIAHFSIGKGGSDAVEPSALPARGLGVEATLALEAAMPFSEGPSTELLPSLTIFSPLSAYAAGPAVIAPRSHALTKGYVHWQRYLTAAKIV